MVCVRIAIRGLCSKPRFLARRYDEYRLGFRKKRGEHVRCRRGLGARPPETVERCVDLLRNIIRGAPERQILDDRADFFPGEHRHPVPDAVLPCHRAVPSRIEQDLAAAPMRHRLVTDRRRVAEDAEAMRQVEYRIGCHELTTEVGHHVRGDEEPEASLREERQRAVVSVEQRGLREPPVLDRPERSDLFPRLAAVEAPLEERPAWKLCPLESRVHRRNHLVRSCIAHDSPRSLALPLTTVAAPGREDTPRARGAVIVCDG